MHSKANSMLRPILNLQDSMYYMCEQQGPAHVYRIHADPPNSFNFLGFATEEECLAAYVMHKVQNAEIRKLYITDSNLVPACFIDDALEAKFVVSGDNFSVLVHSVDDLNPIADWVINNTQQIF